MAVKRLSKVDILELMSVSCLLCPSISPLILSQRSFIVRDGDLLLVEIGGCKDELAVYTGIQHFKILPSGCLLARAAQES